MTSRLALDELRSARARRESYVGTWLPEPVLGEPDPAERAELRESLTAAFLLVLETLGPERIVLGSNYPEYRPIQVMNALRRLELGKQAEELIFGGNLARIYGL